MHYWIGVASRDHVIKGKAGGFYQLGHGKAAPVKRLHPGDRIVYYSPRTAFEGGEPVQAFVVQAFTAIGEILPGEPYVSDMGGGFMPTRRDVRWFEAGEAPIRPLLEQLSFTRGQRSWGYAFRRGAFEMTAEDYALIAAAMGVRLSQARPAG